MSRLLRELRHALRALRNDPGYTVVAILLFALGIGANTAIFSVADSVLLRPLAYRDPDRLAVALHNGDAPVSPADYFDYKKSVPAFEQMAAAQMWGATVTDNNRRERISGLQVSANMTSVLGVQPLLGRPFRLEEEHAGRSSEVLLSYELWQRRFGGSHGIVGQSIRLDGIPYTVVGVMPRGFRFAPFWATRAQMWSPLVLDARVQDRGGRSLRVFARLRRQATLAQAQAQMNLVATRLAKQFPQSNAGLGISVISLKEKVVGPVRPVILILLGTVGLVLLVACVTVGNLALVRAVARRKEIALRFALGARRADILFATLIEVLLLAAAGCVGGMLLGSVTVDLLLATVPPESMPRMAEISFDRGGILLALLLALASTLLAGWLPAWQATRSDLHSDLKEAARGGTHGGRGAGRSLLVGAEVALSLVLSIGAGLMARTMISLAAVNPGFQSRGLATVQVSISGTELDRQGRRANVFRAAQERLSVFPGIAAVSAINHLPMAGDMWRLDYSIPGQRERKPGDELAAIYRVIMPDYFRVMGGSLVAGRDFTANDDDRHSAVAIVNASMARRRWPGESALGKVISYGITPQDKGTRFLIVGVARDMRQGDWTGALQDEIYLPYYQRPDSMGLSYMTFVMRAQGSGEDVLDGAGKALSQMEGGLTASEAATMTQIISEKLWQQRLATAVMGGFAFVALLLAVAGIYGVVSHSMRQRIPEIGIRMALGAKAGDVIRLALRQGMAPIVFGLLAGTLFALPLSPLLGALLYGVRATDPATFIAVAAALMVICIPANLLPAFRAARIDPLTALRNE